MILSCWALVLASLVVVAVLESVVGCEWCGPFVLIPIWVVLGIVEAWLSESECRRISETWRRFWEAGR